MREESVLHPQVNLRNSSEHSQAICNAPNVRRRLLLLDLPPVRDVIQRLLRVDRRCVLVVRVIFGPTPHLEVLLNVCHPA